MMKRGLTASLLLHLSLIILLITQQVGTSSPREQTQESTPLQVELISPLTESTPEPDVLAKSDKVEESEDEEDPKNTSSPTPEVDEPDEDSDNMIASSKITPPINVPTHLDDNCNGGPFYGGIGIMEEGEYYFGYRRVSKVYRGYPAEHVGVMVNDYLVSPPSSEVRGKPGTRVTITIYRGTDTLTFDIVRDKICLGDTRP